MTASNGLIERVVEIALKERVRLKRGENVIIESWPHGLDLAREFAFQARALGAHPMLLLEDESAFFRGVEHLKPGALRAGSHEWAALGKAQAYVFLPGPADIARVWANGAKMAHAYPSNEEWYARAKRARIRGVRILYGYTSPERAAAYGLDLSEWRAMVLEAATVTPAAIRPKAAKLARALLKGKRVRITAGNGTDLSFRLCGRRPQVDDGSVSPEDLRNGDNITQAPAGQLWVAPEERTAEGTIVFDRPSLSLGRPVKEPSFEFRGGRLVASYFEENGERFDKAFSRAKGDKDRLGMLVFGLNPKVRTGFPQDAIASGCVSLSLGANGELGGKNKTSFTFLTPHASATVEVDGKPLVEAGRLTS